MTILSPMSWAIPPQTTFYKEQLRQQPGYGSNTSTTGSPVPQSGKLAWHNAN